MALSKDLEATQQIISLFENAKEKCEESLETLPGIYCVINSAGEIFKSNIGLADFFETPDHETLLMRNLAELFPKESWDDFVRHLNDIQISHHAIEFHGNIRGPAKQEKAILNYLWHLRPLVILNQEQTPFLIAVLGSDVTDLNLATVRSTRMQLELDTARLVQDTLSPPPLAHFGRSTIAGFNRPATECGGDWWHYCMMKDQLFLWVGDVTGHGVPAALVTSAVNSAATILTDRDMSALEVVHTLDRVVFATAHGKRFMTACIISLDLKTGKGEYVSASHEPPIILPGGLEKLTFKNIQFLYSNATAPLGSEQASRYTASEFKLHPGDRLCLYTDGIYDASERGSNTSFYRSLVALANDRPGSAELAEGLQTMVDTFSTSHSLHDDITFFSLHYRI